MKKLAEDHKSRINSDYSSSRHLEAPYFGLNEVMLDEIAREAAGRDVYVIVVDREESAHEWSQRHRIVNHYYFEGELLSAYPYLEKFPKWNAIFHVRHRNPNVYLLGSAAHRWLTRKNESYGFKQLMR
jgi:hypothetical protein